MAAEKRQEKSEKSEKPKKTRKKTEKVVSESTTIRRIRKSLTDQLDAQGKSADFYRDLVNDYIWYFKTREKLKRDVEYRGVMVPVTNGKGEVTGHKTHDGIIQMTKVTSTMLKILHDLNLREPVARKTDEADPSSYF